MKPETFEYVVKNNLCLFQKGPLSNWWGGFPGQNGGFKRMIYNSYGKCYAWLDKTTEWNDLQWNCAEQWMMANKATLFDDLETLKKILDTTHPAEQKKLGREVVGFQPDVWDDVKYEIVGAGILDKFEQNLDLEVFLNQFHPDTIFAEAAPWDSVWGIGLGPNDPDALDIYKWKGENLLGRIIGEVRRNFELIKTDV